MPYWYRKLPLLVTCATMASGAFTALAPAVQAAPKQASSQVRAVLTSAAAAASVPAGPVWSTPVTGTPHLLATGSDQIRQIVQCGGTMYAVGTFSQIKRGSTTYSRYNVFSFAASKPYAVSAWAPNVNGTVNSITFIGSNCAGAYLGGKFTAIGGTTVRDIAEVSTTTGAVITSFGHSASGMVETLRSYGAHLIAGGNFTSVNGSSANPYLVSLNATTGHDDGFIHLSISGHYSYPGVSANNTRIYNQALSHGGALDLVLGDFTSVGGLPRQQIFMLNLTGAHATVTGWTSPQWDGSQGMATPLHPGNGYPYQCAGVEPDYIRAASWSPDDRTVYIGTTGYHPDGWPTSGPRTGLCDAAAAFPATQAPVKSRWINYTGCDSLYATAADASTAYFAGHERWSQNPHGCDTAGPGAISAPGIEGLRAGTGALLVNSKGTGLYTRARGLGADDMLITAAGLWIASDNMYGSQMCGGVNGLAGLCLLPY